mgnify:CR=1 FL=1
MNYGALLRSKRMECGLLQEDLAKKMGVSQRTISSWETGRTVPDLETYNKLSAILGCSISELTGQKADVSSISAQDILVRLPGLRLEELQEIHEHTEREIREKERMLQILIEKEDLEKQLASLKARLEKYNHMEGGDPDAKG